jgi:hypothetical protein
LSRAVVVHLRRVFVLRVDTQIDASGAEPREIEVRVKHVRLVKRPTSRRAEPETLAPQIGTPVANTKRRAVARPHAAKQELESIVALARLSAFEQTALRVFVELRDNAGSPLGPQACPFVGSLLSYFFLPRGGLRIELRYVKEEEGSNDQYTLWRHKKATHNLLLRILASS